MSSAQLSHVPLEMCLLGNEAAARGALEAGVEGVFAYPGTPSTEISMSFFELTHQPDSGSPCRIDPTGKALPPYFEYSINEKVAMEKAIAFSIANRPALCCMKNAGLNVASDPLLNIPYQALGAALVVVVCDDPGCHSSSNEQDSRHWSEAAKVPLFDAASPEEAYEMMRDAFALSPLIQLPVLVRLTTRVSHARSVIYAHSLPQPPDSAHFKRLPEHINVPNHNRSSHRLLLKRLASKSVFPFNERHNRIMAEPASAQYGVIVGGVSAGYTLDQARDLGVDKHLAMLKIGLIQPFPQTVVVELLQRYSQVLVIEELDPIIEDQVRITAQKYRCHGHIFGKGDFGLEPVGEFNPALIRQALCDFTGCADPNAGRALPRIDIPTTELPVRPPILCAGCPHRATYYGLKLAISQHRQDVILCGDIGCLGLGALPPLRMMDTLHHMGMSLSMAQGLDAALARHNDGRDRPVALLGDGTFFHSGIPALVNAVYTRARMTVIIFDNRAIAMTGGQPHPGAPGGASANPFGEVAIEPLVRGLGVKYVATMDPLDLDQTCTEIHQAMAFEGVSVLISKSPCVMLATASEPRHRVTVDPALCRRCGNQDAPDLHCSQSAANGSGLARARGNRLAPRRIDARAQRCPANICNHGFFNAIMAQDYQAALEIVRDKMAFAGACGEICHRPCESSDDNLIPIRALKAFASSITHHHEDLTNVRQRVASAKKQSYRVVVVGSGPAGLSAAYDLIQAGYAVTVLEKESQAGGLLTQVIPDYRLDKRRYQQEVQLLEQLGVDIRFNTALGRDVQLTALTDSYDAVILASGLDQAVSLPLVESAMAPERWYFANHFLSEFNSNTLELEPGTTALVIGGGNSAMDAARAAGRHPAVVRVVVSCIERVEAMPAFAEEVNAALTEGIEIIGHSELHSCEATARGARVQLNSVSGGEALAQIEAGVIVVAIGRHASDFSAGTKTPLSRAVDGRLPEANDGPPACVASHQHHNIFVAGDLGQANHQSLIGAIGSGKRAATGVRHRLENRTAPYEGEEALAALQRPTLQPLPQCNAPPALTIDPHQDQELLQKFALIQTCASCNHCIDDFGCPSLVLINGRITIDQASCTGCGLCIDVCPNGAIQAVPPAPGDIRPGKA
ncbi:MAG: FAD-dependent oxidoreductase [Arenicellales bacterium]|jgi:indolepyruvate ferredoxin oxidoreductase alpha subunit|nr:FAD-dependent oxidoreductase [Arenicellales bacterium]MDP6552632.1 FAD-dependent oxidoreductase [Arenicellales bacterium]MDP6791178.1 FAD-dependent oxidoreductase [Arenicellales bacterium]MDP6917795.1 FAD-dependent oxidoreductase [Arenicellales bacterium]|tara:strand:- start:7037 stop:10447 length:3411 start_codon:yes stop_codon:yes gene_type:complete